MIKNSSDKYRKSSTECLVIGCCLYIAIAYQFNRSENCGRINVSSVTQYSTSQLLNYVGPYFLACTFGHNFGATDVSCTVSGFGQSRKLNTFVMDVKDRSKEFLRI